MKLYKISFVLLLGLGALTSCDSKLDVTNPNQQTAATFKEDLSALEETVIAAYNPYGGYLCSCRLHARRVPW